ncbi:hypothetical protein BJ508DRAFT_333845 [Ascobolus immersus RN42]|uniref:Uncharacterized protein n=1 Tax=Ascobolus immersus RN42 TaxID=1160509 RepID=A0A3N4HNR4_ASCIM|nr:hypothetical protein BJ508DRAFT_333845 [Ascobolus immersus RN42]
MPPRRPQPRWSRLSLETRIRTLKDKRKSFLTRLELFNHRRRNTHQLFSAYAERHGQPGWEAVPYQTPEFPLLTAKTIDSEELSLAVYEFQLSRSRKFGQLQELFLEALELDNVEGIWEAYMFAKREGLYKGKKPTTQEECSDAIMSVRKPWSEEELDDAVYEEAAKLHLIKP